MVQTVKAIRTFPYKTERACGEACAVKSLRSGKLIGDVDHDIVCSRDVRTGSVAGTVPSKPKDLACRLVGDIESLEAPVSLRHPVERPFAASDPGVAGICGDLNRYCIILKILFLRVHEDSAYESERH